WPDASGASLVVGPGPGLAPLLMPTMLSRQDELCRARQGRVWIVSLTTRSPAHSSRTRWPKRSSRSPPAANAAPSKASSRPSPSSTEPAPVAGSKSFTVACTPPAYGRAGPCSRTRLRARSAPRPALLPRRRHPVARRACDAHSLVASAVLGCSAPRSLRSSARRTTTVSPSVASAGLRCSLAVASAVRMRSVRQADPGGEPAQRASGAAFGPGQRLPGVPHHRVVPGLRRGQPAGRLQAIQGLRPVAVPQVRPGQVDVVMAGPFGRHPGRHVEALGPPDRLRAVAQLDRDRHLVDPHVRRAERKLVVVVVAAG